MPPCPLPISVDGSVGPNDAVVECERPVGDREVRMRLTLGDGQTAYDGDDEAVEVGPQRADGHERVDEADTTKAPASGNRRGKRLLDPLTSRSSSSEDDSNGMSAALPSATVNRPSSNGIGKRQRDKGPGTSSASEDDNNNIDVLPPPKRHASGLAIGTLLFCVWSISIIAKQLQL